MSLVNISGTSSQIKTWNCLRCSVYCVLLFTWNYRLALLHNQEVQQLYHNVECSLVAELKFWVKSDNNTNSWTPLQQSLPLDVLQTHLQTLPQEIVAKVKAKVNLKHGAHQEAAKTQAPESILIQSVALIVQTFMKKQNLEKRTFAHAETKVLCLFLLHLVHAQQEVEIKKWQIKFMFFNAYALKHVLAPHLPIGLKFIQDQHKMMTICNIKYNFVF